MKTAKQSHTANFNLYIKNIHVDISDWLAERSTKSEDDLVVEILENLFPIEILLDYAPSNLFSDQSPIIHATDQDCVILYNFDEKTITIGLDVDFTLNCHKKFSEDLYENWCSETDGFNPPGIDLKIGEYEGDDGGSVSPIFKEE